MLRRPRRHRRVLRPLRPCRGRHAGERLRVVARLGQARRDVPVHDHRHGPGHRRDGDADGAAAARPSPGRDVGRRHARAGADGAQGVRGATADTLAQDPEIVWKNLSRGDAQLRRRRRPSTLARAEGDPARRRLRHRALRRPAVPGRAGRLRRPHARPPPHAATKLASKINDPANPGSTFNLYQEMSYGQLFPHGDRAVGRHRDRATGPTRPASRSARAAPRRHLPAARPRPTCPATHDQPLHPDRDQGRLVPAARHDRLLRRRRQRARRSSARWPGVGALQDIDSACGPTGKAVFDAAQIADPEIDYDDYDTDKDGVVDFFMMVFPGVGGNGDSQLNGAPYDNIWPHSSDLRERLHRPGTGQKGYVTDDQLARPRGPAAVLDTDATRIEDDDDGHDGLPGLRARRPVQRQPRDGDRPRERDLARVRPLARAAGLLLDRQPRDLRRLDADGDRLLAEHRRRSASRSSAGSSRGCSSPARRTVSDWQRHQARHAPDRLEAPGRHAVHADRRPTVDNGAGVRAPSCPAARSSTRRRCRRGSHHVWWSRLGQRLRLRADRAATTSTSRCRRSRRAGGHEA